MRYLKVFEDFINEDNYLDQYYSDPDNYNVEVVDINSEKIIRISNKNGEGEQKDYKLFN